MTVTHVLSEEPGLEEIEPGVGELLAATDEMKSTGASMVVRPFLAVGGGIDLEVALYCVAAEVEYLPLGSVSFYEWNLQKERNGDGSTATH